MLTAPRICRHCKKSSINRPRGLCWVCYYTPGVRELYPSTSKYARRGVGNFAGPARPAEPGPVRPGTPEKVETMAARAQRGEDLFHPEDGRVESPGSARAEIEEVLGESTHG